MANEIVIKHIGDTVQIPTRELPYLVVVHERDPNCKDKLITRYGLCSVPVGPTFGLNKVVDNDQVGEERYSVDGLPGECKFNQKTKVIEA